MCHLVDIRTSKLSPDDVIVAYKQFRITSKPVLSNDEARAFLESQAEKSLYPQYIDNQPAYPINELITAKHDFEDEDLHRTNGCSYIPGFHAYCHSGYGSKSFDVVERKVELRKVRLIGDDLDSNTTVFVADEMRILPE